MQQNTVVALFLNFSNIINQIRKLTYIYFISKITEELMMQDEYSQQDNQQKDNNLIPNETNRSSSVIYSQPEVIQVTSRRKRKQNKSQILTTRTEYKSSLIINSPIFYCEEEESNGSSQGEQNEDSQKSNNSSNKETKPGKTIEYPNEEDQNDEANYGDELKVNETQQYIKKNCVQQKIQESQEQSMEKQESQQEQDEQQLHESIQISEKKKQLTSQIPKQPIYTKIKINQSFRSPVPKGYRISCLLKMQSTLLGLNTIYYLYLRYQDKKQQITSLISAKKQLLSFHPVYIISASQENHSIRNSKYLAKLSGNFSGNQWQLSCLESQASSKISLRSKYISSFMGYRSIRVMEAYKFVPDSKQAKKDIPKINESFTRKQNLLKIQTALPVKSQGKYKLNFRGLVRVASTKNFILHYQPEEKFQKQCLLFAKQDDKSYIMEVSYPLSVLEGFALCLTSLNSKLLVN